MKKTVIFIALILGLSVSMSGREVPQKVAEQVAKNFYYQHVNQVRNVDYKSINLSLSEITLRDNKQTMYAFNINEKDGFVIVSGNDAVKPVLAYAFDNHFNQGNMSPAQAEMLHWYSEQIAWVNQAKISADEKIANEWYELMNYTPDRGVEEIRNVEPLMLVNWDQGWPYNAMCPEDAASQSHGRVYVGCVAVAMCQVMKHWNYPESGTGSYTHSNYANGGYGSRTVNFSQQTYNWEGTPLKAAGENDEMAKICYHVGVAVQMQWGPDGSGSYTEKVKDALVNYFRYDTNCQVMFKSSYSNESEYKNHLKEQLDNKHPMVYAGSGTGSGHAWNCDGYMDDEFHMNWGWGGSGDGYYTLDNLVSSATPGGGEYNFIYNQKAIINIYPKDNYPEYCNGSKTIVAPQGSFGDGSAEMNYQNNINCEYLIAPECGQVIKLKFNKFDLGEGDVINIYEGNTTSATLVATFDADNPPANSYVHSKNTGNMLLTFQTDGASNGDGWYVSFDSEYCRGTAKYTEATGTVNDGSGSCPYVKSLVCYWHIEPEGANAVKLNFTEFDLAEGDFIRVYKNTTSNLINTYNADENPGTIIIDDPKAIIMFYTNSDDNVGDGWTFDYESLESGIETNDVLYGLSVYPNPAVNNVNLSFSLSKPEVLELRVYDMLGKTIYQKRYNASTGYQEIQLNDCFTDSGMYFIDVKAGNNIVTKKISIVQ